MVILVVGPWKIPTVFRRSLTKYKKNRIVSFVNPVGPTFYYFISKHKTFYRCRSQSLSLQAHTKTESIGFTQCLSLQVHTIPESAGSHKARVSRLKRKPESAGSHNARVCRLTQSLSLQAPTKPESAGSHKAWVCRLTHSLSLQAYKTRGSHEPVSLTWHN